MGTLYDEKCPVARTMNVFGDRWTLLIVRDLYLQKGCRFQDLLESLEGVSPNTLSSRLKWLEENEVIERHFYEEHPPRAEYLLTKKGLDFAPALKAMRNWGMQYKNK